MKCPAEKSFKTRALTRILSLAALWLGPGFASAQVPAVNVTITADDAVLFPGQKTMIRVFAQIDASIEADAVGIFTWYIDLLNSNEAVAVPDYDNLTMNTSDNVPNSSSSGTTIGENRRGIHNSMFLSDPGAGKGSPVELLAVEVTPNRLGVATFSVQAGTTKPLLTDDFLVSRTGLPPLSPPFTGGNYAMASVTVSVIPVTKAIELDIRKAAGECVEICFTPKAGFNHTVMFSENQLPGTWTALPGAPHNGGSVIDSEMEPVRKFYSLLLTVQ